MLFDDSRAVYSTDIPGYGVLESSRLDSLVGFNYKIVKAQVFAEQKFRCCMCGDIRPLEADHIETRGAHGRCDKKENLRGMCNTCHRQRHNPRINMRRNLDIHGGKVC